MESPSKKRKRDRETYTVVVSAKDPAELGPVVANFISADPPPETSFQCYFRNEESSRREVDFATQDMLIAGESQHVDFVTRHGPANRLDGGSRYVVGIRNKATKQITIRECPLHIVSREVKRFKGLATIQSDRSMEQRMAQRAKLGEAFGTKKAQKAIRAQERNQVNVGDMENVLGMIGEGVQDRTVNLPTKEQAKEALDASRPIPPFDAESETLEGVYPLSSIIPNGELAALRTSPFVSAAANGTVTKALPFSRSSYINNRLHSMDLTKAPTGGDRKRLQLLIYLSALFAFRAVRFSLSDREAVNERLNLVPQVVIDHLYMKFTESSRGSSKVQVTSEKETLLLATMFVLTLHIDDFVVDSAIVAKDLSMSVAKVNQLYKALGCKIDVPSSAESNRIGTGLGKEKKAILRLPLEFPKARTGKKRK